MVVLLSTPAAALDPPDEILALYYLWGRYTEQCAGQSPEITPRVREAVGKSVQAVEQMILGSRPEPEREQLKQKALQRIADEMAKRKQGPDSDQNICDNAKAFLSSWSIYTMNLETMIKYFQKLQPK